MQCYSLDKCRTERGARQVNNGAGRSGTGKARSVAGAAALEKAMDLLDLVASTTPSVAFAELQDRSGLPRSTLHRLLSALEARGLLRRDAAARTWRLGFRLLELAHGVWSDLDLRAAAATELALLRDTTDETVQFGMLDDNACVIGAAAEGRQMIRIAADVGQRIHWPASALGCAIAASSELATTRTLLAGIPMLQRAELEGALELARGRGYFVQPRIDAEGVTAIAAPIVDYRGVAVAAIGLVGPGFRLQEERLHALAPPLMEAARRLSHNAGGTTMSLAPAAPEGRATHGVRCAVGASALLGEAPYWSGRDGALVWVDMLAPAVHRISLPTSAARAVQRTWPMQRLTSVAIPRRAGGFVLAQPSGLRFFDPDRDIDEAFVHPEAKREGNRYNDGKCDPRGRLWIGTMDPAGQPGRGSLLRVDPDGKWDRVDTGFTVPNGIGFAPRGDTLYFTESAGRTVFAYDLDLRHGTLSKRRVFATWADGVKPDGIAVDEDGAVWVAIWDGWRIERWSAEGKLVRTIRLPVPRPTSVAFGGRDLSTLYITSARIRLTSATLELAPLSGSVFACATGVRGTPVALFAG